MALFQLGKSLVFEKEYPSLPPQFGENLFENLFATKNSTHGFTIGRAKKIPEISCMG